MKRNMKNIRITDKQDYDLERGESCFKWLLLAFLAIAWLCRDIDTATPVHLYRISSAEMPTTQLTVLGWRLF